MAGVGHKEGLPPPHATLLLLGTPWQELQWFFPPVLGPLQLETDFSPTLQMGQLKLGPTVAQWVQESPPGQGTRIQPHAVARRLRDLK